MSDPRRPIDLTHEEALELGAAFVLDALDEAESEAMRAHLATCPLGHDELVELAAVVPVLAAGAPQVQPSAGLRDRILAAAAAEGGSSTAPPAVMSVGSASAAGIPTPAMDADAVSASAAAPAVAARTEPVPIPFPSTEQRTARRRASRGTWLLRIAAVLVIAVLGGWNLLLQGQVNDAKAFQQQVAAVVEVAGQPGSLTAVLRGEDGNGSGLAAISADGTMSVALRGLPPTTGTEVYEAWMIGSDGVPIALGGFPLASGGTAFMEAPGIPTAPGITIALTLEPNAGNTKPAGPVVSSGTTTATG